FSQGPFTLVPPETGNLCVLFVQVDPGQPCWRMSLQWVHMFPCVSVSSAERQQVLGALERLQAKLVQREEWTHSDTLGNLREMLQSPLFSHILTVQYSIKQLQNQVHMDCFLHLQTITAGWLSLSFSFRVLMILPVLTTTHRSVCRCSPAQVLCEQLCEPDFSFSRRGQLIMSTVNPSSLSTPPALSPSSSILTNGLSSCFPQAPPSTDWLQKWILTAAKVGGATASTLSSEGVFPVGRVRDKRLANIFRFLQAEPVTKEQLGDAVVVWTTDVLTEFCCRDGRLQERDQILVINGSPLEPGMSHQQALSLLQQPGHTVELVVARDPHSEGGPVSTVRLQELLQSSNRFSAAIAAHVVGFPQFLLSFNVSFSGPHPGNQIQLVPDQHAWTRETLSQEHLGSF
ncbi:hypothetical protein GOODEAATRI_024835, partial [Goodea atripinnis]